MDLLLTVAVMYGITFGIKDAKLFERPRQWLAARNGFVHSLLSCAYCVGFHSGWLTYFLLVPLSGDLMTDLRLMLAYSFAGVTFSGALDAVLLKVENSA